MKTFRCNLCRVELPECVKGPLFPIKWSTGKRLIVEEDSNTHLCMDCIMSVQIFAASKLGETKATTEVE